jgi:serine/threonine-protein kinase RsbW
MQQFKLTISSNPNNILEIESYLKMMKLDFLYSQEKYGDILISLTEAVNNAIIHGNKSDESKSVTIHARKTNSGIAFCVVDEGSGFNPNYVADPTCADNIECCGGRGVFIMKALSDKISFGPNGNEVEMFFELNKATV